MSLWLLNDIVYNNWINIDYRIKLLLWFRKRGVKVIDDVLRTFCAGQKGPPGQNLVGGSLGQKIDESSSLWNKYWGKFTYIYVPLL